jgi:hypothetical protein
LITVRRRVTGRQFQVAYELSGFNGGQRFWAGHGSETHWNAGGIPAARVS